MPVRPEIGAVGAKLYYSNDTIQHGGVILGLGGVAGHSHKHQPRDTPGYFRRLFLTQNLSAVTGACLVVRKDSYLKVNGMDSEKLTVAFYDYRKSPTSTAVPMKCLVYGGTLAHYTGNAAMPRGVNGCQARRGMRGLSVFLRGELTRAESKQASRNE